MKWFTNLSTPAKLLLAFGSMFIILAIVIFTSYKSIARMTHSVQFIHDNQFTIMIELEKLNSHQNYTRGQLLEMVLSPDQLSQKKFERNIDERSAQMDSIISAISRLELDPTSRGQITELSDTLAMHRQARAQLIAMMHDGKTEEAKQLALGVQDESYDKLRALASRLIESSSISLNAIMDKDKQDASKSIKFCLIMGVIALLVSIVMILLLHFTMASPLSEISAIATRIASGDLTAKIAVDNRTDEMGVMTQAFRKMNETLADQIQQIMDGVNVLASSSNEILVSTSQLASGAVESATGISETMTTVEEVRQAARLSSEKAKTVSDGAQRVAMVSQTGKNAVDETAATMLHIRDQMVAISQTILRLSDQSQAIGGIIASVTDLADQSNLLAVNAAIEAAKAGEQGRGFVVVAQEIKNLAEQSKQATTQIRDILTEVQKTTNIAVLATEQGTKAVEGGVKQASQTGDAVRLLTESSLDASKVAIQIVASSQQQVVGMDQIGVAMTNINQAGAQNASAMKQAEIAARSLSELGQKLRKLVDQFKIKGA